MENTIKFTIAIILSILLGLLGTHVILSVSNLYGLTFITELGFLKLYGALSVISIVLYKHTDDFKGEDTKNKIKEAYERIFDKLFVYLIFWGASFLMYYILS